MKCFFKYIPTSRTFLPNFLLTTLGTILFWGVTTLISPEYGDIKQLTSKLSAEQRKEPTKLDLVNSQASDSEPLSIGALLCLTGECANFGQQSLKGATLAIEEINTIGGINGRKLNLVVTDSQEAISGAHAVLGYRKLKSEHKLTALIGPTWSPAATALKPIITRDNLPTISPSVGIADFHLGAPNIFNSRGTDERSTTKLADWAFENGLRKISIVSSQQQWVQLQADVFTERFKSLGGEIITRIEPPPTSTLFPSDLTKLVTDQPDAIFISNLLHQAFAAKGLHSLGYRGRLLSTLIDRQQLDLAPEALSDVVHVGVEFPLVKLDHKSEIQSDLRYPITPHNIDYITARLTESSQDFTQIFKERFHVAPIIEAATAYDAVLALAIALGQIPTQEQSASEIIQQLSRVKFQGAAGPVSFSPEGEALRPTKIFLSPAR